MGDPDAVAVQGGGPVFPVRRPQECTRRGPGEKRPTSRVSSISGTDFPTSGLDC